MVMLPVATVHVGCTTLTVGAAGVGGCGLIMMVVTEEIQLLLFCAVRVYVPGARLAYGPVYGTYALPLKLKFNPAVADVIVIDPVATVQDG
jgi:hypothetical protein